MTIRKYENIDKQNVLELLRLNTPKYFSKSEETDLHYYLENHSENFYLIEKEGKIVACGGYNIISGRKLARISWDIVHPSHQGINIGTKLLLFRIEKIKQISSLDMLEVRTSQLAFNYYSKFGFVTKEIIPDYWAIGYDLYRMEQEIT